ncbi:leucyl aminopeptidase [Methylobacterium isbiliense]|jgi:leucyl aminopeptidase|uniref:Probable cytosol aminopeptidase n=1 Tax=Methylobacterium isbiliense TaxID=315478 RepID=A0ABQ4S8N6_9HYPH|nr:leucyl aminopeptidase [Methylobacterium isbiliense]MDN3621967.1 leucyl aminopeptidase [Methylobacterium isbiliense]GJD99519.1 Cytosol aminopeptidase [Methylobacterium isbiliense]
MADGISIAFEPLDSAKGQDPGDLVLFVGEDLALSERAAEIAGGAASDLVARAAGVERFKGKANAAFTVTAPAGLSAERLIVVGVGPEKDRGKLDWATLGGVTAGKLNGRRATVVLDLATGAPSAEQAAEFSLGLRLRGYKFDRYKSKKAEGEETGATRVTVLTAEAGGMKKPLRAAEAVAEGVITARELVNEPPNVLDPEEFARRTEALEKLGVSVEILDEKALRKIGMRALLAVAQGSAKEARVVIMRWNGGDDASEAPIAFVGKGVCFDSGGISIKGSGGMEDMKGDMAGAACVVGLMQALAQRKARVNALGAIGIVENMPDGKAQRPGDIVTSLSGQTIEIINTDAEGRLVLADVLWHVQQEYKPKFMIDLATLTGAVMVALGQEFAGMFTTSDELAERLTAAGEATGEKVWRMPLSPGFDKLIDSKFADMKNTGGRHGGSATAAQFIKRFVNDVPWVHLDIAGVGMNAPSSEISRSWGSGWGVRLLDRMVRDHYER